jgi:hypothetical protein
MSAVITGSGLLHRLGKVKMGLIRNFLVDVLGRRVRQRADPLVRMIFTDGEIHSYTIANDTLIMHFSSYAENPMLLRFTGGIEVIEQGSVGHHIGESRLENNGDRRTLTLIYEELLLSITFRNYEVTYL